MSCGTRGDRLGAIRGFIGVVWWLLDPCAHTMLALNLGNLSQQKVLEWVGRDEKHHLCLLEDRELEWV